MFQVILEEGFEELGDLALIKVNGGACTGYSGGSCTSSGGGGGGGGGGDTPSNSGTCTAVVSNPGSCTAGPGKNAIQTQNTAVFDDYLASVGYIFVEGLGIINTSKINVTTLVKDDGTINVSTSGVFAGENGIESSEFYGTISLVVDGAVVEQRAIAIDPSDGTPLNPDHIGTVNFTTQVDGNASSVSVVTNIDLRLSTDNGYNDYIVDYRAHETVIW